METKVCGKCKQEKPVSEFWKSKRDGYQPFCKPCKRDVATKDYARLKAEGYYNKRWLTYFQRPDVREKRLKRLREYNKNPQVQIRNFARRYVRNEIRAGRLDRQPCAFCGKTNAEAHHPDYDKPLLIVWACNECHHKLHNLLKKELGL